VGLPAFSVLRVCVVASMWYIGELVLEILCGGLFLCFHEFYEGACGFGHCDLITNSQCSVADAGM
jgi:hypothetical protein